MTKDDTDVMDSPSLESPPIITGNLSSISFFKYEYSIVERKRKTAKDTSLDKMVSVNKSIFFISLH